MAEARKTYSLSGLMAAPRGVTTYASGEAFLLHVFWVAPSMAAALELLAGLQRCATATHRDTPCTTTYFFRVTQNDAALCPPQRRLVSDHADLMGAHKRLRVGTPAPVVHANLKRMGLDPALLDLDIDGELPAEMQTQPVQVEFTEVYLDEQAFMRHAGSRDYLDGYAVVMKPELVFNKPTTIRLGSPTATMVETILEPILHELVMPLAPGCSVWQQRPHTAPHSAACESVGHSSAIFLSLDFDSSTAAAADSGVGSGEMALPAAVTVAAATCVSFAHPLRPGTTRVMCVLPAATHAAALHALAALAPHRGEAHMAPGDDAAIDAARAALQSAGLHMVTLNATYGVGYVLHARAGDITLAV